MKELVLSAFGYEAEIRFSDGMVDQFEDAILAELKRRTDIMLYSSSSTSIMICFADHRGMMEFAAYICSLCLPFV